MEPGVRATEQPEHRGGGIVGDQTGEVVGSVDRDREAAPAGFGLQLDPARQQRLCVFLGEGNPIS